MTTNKETLSLWKDVPSCPGYMASNCGRIHSPFVCRNLIGSIDRYGYRNVNITVAGKEVRRKVHRLVCEAWHGVPPTAEHHAAHLDGNSQNNRADNLIWATARENAAHKKMQNRPNGGASGERHPSAKLGQSEIAEIRSSIGTSTRELGRRYGVSSGQISRIRTGKRWPSGIAQGVSHDSFH